MRARTNLDALGAGAVPDVDALRAPAPPPGAGERTQVAAGDPRRVSTPALVPHRSRARPASIPRSSGTGGSGGTEPRLGCESRRRGARSGIGRLCGPVGNPGGIAAFRREPRPSAGALIGRRPPAGGVRPSRRRRQDARGKVLPLGAGSGVRPGAKDAADGDALCSIHGLPSRGLPTGGRFTWNGCGSPAGGTRGGPLGRVLRRRLDRHPALGAGLPARRVPRETAPSSEGVLRVQWRPRSRDGAARKNVSESCISRSASR